MNDESNALMMRVMCNKDPTVRCAGQCDDPQCVTNANRNVTVSFNCPNCPTHLAQIETLTREKAELDDERKAQQYLAITRGELIETLRIVIGAQDKTLQESVAKIGLQDGVVTSVELPKAIGTLRANYEYLVKQIDVMASDSYKWEAKVKALRAELDAAKVDVARYEWWRANFGCLEDDGDGIEGCAFSCQIPIRTLQNATHAELFDMIADYEIDTARSRGETGETK